jgi:hypothetical protein
MISLSPTDQYLHMMRCILYTFEGACRLGFNLNKCHLCPHLVHRRACHPGHRVLPVHGCRVFDQVLGHSFILEEIVEVSSAGPGRLGGR